MLVWQLDAEGGRKAVEDDPAVKPLRAAREGRIVFSTPGTVDDAITSATVLSLPVAVDGLVPRIAKAIDGDPRT